MHSLYNLYTSTTQCRQSTCFLHFSPPLLRYHAAVDHQGRAATEVARSACQENHRASEIFWQAPPACRCPVNDVLGVLCVLGVDFCHCCFDVSGWRVSDKRAARYRSLGAALASERTCVSELRVSIVRQRNCTRTCCRRDYSTMSTHPGHIQFTLIPCFAHSLLIAFVICSTPPFVQA